MVGRTITSYIATTVTLGSSSYISPLYVASSGIIAPTAGANAIYGPANLLGFTLTNQGSIAGGQGVNEGSLGTFISLTGGNGGDGLDIKSLESLSNTGSLAGGAGGHAGYTAAGGAGGAGAVLSVATFVNEAGISGGNGGKSAYANNSGKGGAAGDGVDITTGTMFDNQGTIAGGVGGASYNGATGTGGGGAGGIGANLANVMSMTNEAAILGGMGAAAGTGSSSAGAGGAGGNGLADTSTSTATIANTGMISGATGGTGGADAGAGGAGGHGGDGVALSGAVTLGNGGTISGGAGGKAATDFGQHYSGANGGLGGTGATLSGAAALSNASTGAILGGAGGAATSGPQNAGAGGAGADGLDSASTGSLVNQGTIAAGVGANGGSSILGQLGYSGGAGGAGGMGIDAVAKLSISNTGLIEGGSGGASGVGAIATAGGAGGAGVALVAGDVLSNSGRIVAGAGGAGGSAPTAGNGGTGGAGVYLNGATLINSGTIAGGTGGAAGNTNSGVGSNGAAGEAGNAVKFSVTAASTLIVESGALFTGNVVASTAVADVLELSGTSTEELAGIGTQFQNFNDISFTADAAWTIAGNSAGLAAHEAIGGFANGDTIDLTGFAMPTSFGFSNNTLTLSNATTTATLDITTSYVNPDFHVQSDGAGGSFIEVTCFCAGTRILGLHGERLVEDIAVGEELVTVREDGPVTQKVVWTGRRAIDIRQHPRPALARPVRITAGAIAPGVPARDLRLSPEHAIYVDGKLFTALSLVNGTTIHQELNTTHVTYYHIELASHDILMAEGLPVESFLDAGNKTMFDNVSGVIRLHPDFRPGPDALFCVPLVREGDALLDLRAVLGRRASLKANSTGRKHEAPCVSFGDATLSRSAGP